MTDISAQAVYALRTRTGVSILECKKALEESGGDEEKAIEFLRKRGVAAATKKADREQAEGIVFIEQRGNKAGVVELRCETDFVALDEHFQSAGRELAVVLVEQGEEAAKKLAEEKVPGLVQKLGENISTGILQLIEADTLGVYVHSNGKIGVVVGLQSGSNEAAKDAAMHAAAMNPQFVHPEEVSEEAVEKERAIWRDQLSKENKPEQIMQKIMEGKEKKFREESALLTQSFVKDPSKTVGEFLSGATVTTYLRASIKG